MRSGRPRAPGRHYNPLVLTGPAGRGRRICSTRWASGSPSADPKGRWPVCPPRRSSTSSSRRSRGTGSSGGAAATGGRPRSCSTTSARAGKERSQEELFNLFNRPAPRGAAARLHDGRIARQAGRRRAAARLAVEGRSCRRAGPSRPFGAYAAAERLLTEEGVAGTGPARLLGRPTGRVGPRSRSLVQRVLDAASQRERPVSAGLAREVLEGQSRARPTIERVSHERYRRLEPRGDPESRENGVGVAGFR